MTVTRVGKQKHYQTNAAAPVYEELRGNRATSRPAGGARNEKDFVFPGLDIVNPWASASPLA